MNRIGFSILIVLILVSLASAETKYITTDFRVSVRETQSEESKRLGIFKAGDQIELIKIEKLWALIKLPNGQQGWVVSRYVVDDPPMKEVVSKLKQDLVLLKEENSALNLELNDLEKKNVTLKKESNLVTKNVSGIQHELELKKGYHRVLGIILGGIFVIIGIIIGIFIGRPRDGGYNDSLLKTIR